MKRISVYGTVRDAISNFLADDAMTSGAGLAFYSSLSLAPLILLFVSLAGFIGNGTQEALVNQFSELVGSDGAQAIKMIIDSAQKDNENGVFGSLVSIGILILSASAIFVQFQEVLNRIFKVEENPGMQLKTWIRRRLFSIGMLFTFGFFLHVSLIVSTLLQLASFQGEGLLWELLNFTISILVFSAFFAVVYKYFPSIRMDWSMFGRGP